MFRSLGSRLGLVGVLAFDCEKESEEAGTSEVVFVLLKGEFAGEMPPRIRAISFGNPGRIDLLAAPMTCASVI